MVEFRIWAIERLCCGMMDGQQSGCIPRRVGGEGRCGGCREGCRGGGGREVCHKVRVRVKRWEEWGAGPALEYRIMGSDVRGNVCSDTMGEDGSPGC